MAKFFRQIFSKHGVRSVLDCACGTGRHLLLVNNLGCKVWGSDVSEAMLAQARKNLARFEVSFPLKQADYRDLAEHFERGLNAVACLGSIGHMPNEKEFLQAFGSMPTMLHEGGILVMTTIPTDKQWAEKPQCKLSANSPDLTRLFVLDYFERSVSYHILDIFHSLERKNSWCGVLSLPCC